MSAHKKQRGQSAVIAVVALIVLSIGMYTTYNLSRAVYEKIQLQNAADAAAFSLATQEARSFNFVAFSNRAQVANYVQMLEMQSLLSSASYVEAFGGVLSDLFYSLEKVFKLCGIFSSSCRAAARVAGDVGDIYWQIHENGERAVNALDDFVPTYIRAKTTMNQALFAVSVMHVLATSTQLVDGASDIFLANDPDATQHPITIAIRAFNTASYLCSFDLSITSICGGGNSSDDEKKRVMTEVVNASRYHDGVFDPRFIASRGPMDTLLATPNLGSGGGRRAREARKTIADVIARFLAPGFTGTAKLLKEQSGAPETFDASGDAAPDRSYLSSGDTIMAKDAHPSGLLSRFWGDSVGVISSTDTGVHCRYERPGDHGAIYRFAVLGVQLITGSQDLECREDSKHVWDALIGQGGITPYLKMAAHRDGLSSEARGFNQPDVWVWLTKSSEDMEPAGDISDLQFSFENIGGGDSDLDARIGQDGAFEWGLLPGMNAVARAQVYYHRPGAWHEPPNFFNPYWGARLAPKGAAVERLADAIGGSFADFLRDNVWMH